MKRLASCLCTLCCLLCGCAAAPSQAVEQTVEEEPFDMAQAWSLLASTERCVVDLVHGGNGLDYGLWLNAFQSSYSELGQPLLDTLLVPAHWPDDRVLSLEGRFFPTVYHQGMEISEAVLYTQTTTYRAQGGYSSCTEINQLLRITETYTGSGRALDGFSRVNCFVRGKTQYGREIWVFCRFEGDLDVGGDNVNQMYLALREPELFRRGRRVGDMLKPL